MQRWSMRDAMRRGRGRRAAAAVLASALLALQGLPTPAAAADPAKTLRVAFSIAEMSFDPQFASDAASDGIIDNIFDAMLDYDYLARPVKLVPRTLEAMPTVEDGGATYVFKLKKGIFFTPDPAFKGKPRELTAADQAYALKRLLDPAVKSPWLWLLEGKIVGADEVREQGAASPASSTTTRRFAGLEVVDRYTLRIRLKQPDLRFLYVLAVPNTAAVAREVVEAYGLDIGAHPVGTGAYVLGEYRRSAKIVLVANPGYRETTYVPAGPVPPESAPIAAALKGKRLPLVGRIEIAIIEEGQARWLAFPTASSTCSSGCRRSSSTRRSPTASSGPTSRPRASGTRCCCGRTRAGPTSTWRTRSSAATRRRRSRCAARSAWATTSTSSSASSSRAARVPATSPIPPDIAGYDPALKTAAQLYDPAAARALLDRFGYKDRDGDGYREAPDGKPLVLERWSTPTSLARQEDELWKKNMDAIGLRIVFKKDKLPELRKMARQGKIPMRGDGWNADYPDAENFMQLLYGPNVGQENHARFNLPEFDQLYDEARTLPDSPERTRLFDRMTELVVAYAPWRLTEHRIEDHAASSRGSATTSRTRSARRSGGTSTSTRRCARSERRSSGAGVTVPRGGPRLQRAPDHDRVVVVAVACGDRVGEQRACAAGRTAHRRPGAPPTSRRCRRPWRGCVAAARGA